MPKIIVVDDIPAIVDFNKEFFEDAGFDVRTADTAPAAINMQQQFKADVILQDLNIHGFHRHAAQFGDLSVYGSDARAIKALARQDPASQHEVRRAQELMLRRLEADWHAVAARRGKKVSDIVGRRADAAGEAATAE